MLTTKAVKDETEQRILRDAHVCHTDTHKHIVSIVEHSFFFLQKYIQLDKQETFINVAHEKLELLMHSLPCSKTSDELCNVPAGVFDAVALSDSLCLCVGEGCSGSHPAADVAGKGRAGGKGDRADCSTLCQYVPPVSGVVDTLHEEHEHGGKLLRHLHMICFCVML